MNDTLSSKEAVELIAVVRRDERRRCVERLRSYGRLHGDGTTAGVAAVIGKAWCAAIQDAADLLEREGVDHE